MALILTAQTLLSQSNPDFQKLVKWFDDSLILLVTHDFRVQKIAFYCFKLKLNILSYSLPSINVNPREWIKVNIYRGVNT